jgi:tetratricopeptide (TPR) repeat protein
MVELRNRLETALSGRYTIGREIGRGGMAIVYLARDVRHGRDVALKVLRPELAATLGPERFLQEIRLAAGLAHPHILPLHDSGEADGCLFYVMPFVPGESLRDRLERDGQLPLVDALAIAREIADALGYAHQAGVVHRDIKPENILLQAGHAVVSDFGIARAISAAGSRRVTAVGTTVGTPDYMSPEQAAGTGPIDGRSDIYSLGCVLFEMLAGTPPAALTPPEGPAAGPLRPRDRLAELVALRPSVPPAVAGVVARMLAPAPGDRFATGAEAAEALAAPADVWTPRSVAAQRRRRIGVGVGAGVLVAASAFILPRVLGSTLDRALYVVSPCADFTNAEPSLLDSDRCQRLLDGAVRQREWQDVHVVPIMQVVDEGARHARPVSLDGALGQARQLRAGLLLYAEVFQSRDSILVSASVYDVRRHVRIREHHVMIPKDLSELDVKFGELVDSLMLGNGNGPGRTASALRTTQLAALLAFDTGQAAVDRWDLPEAARAFRVAVGRDSGFADANLWLAQVLEWQGAPTDEWARFAARATRTDALGPEPLRDAAAALQALADGRYQDACAQYQTLLKRDTLSFTGWFGLAECNATDRGVVRDAASPSRWRFRGSMRTAFQAYRRALEMLPSAHRAFASRLPDLFFIEAAYYRSGTAVSPDTGRYGAWPQIVNDTLAFIPYPQAQFDTMRVPQTGGAALAFTRSLVLEIATNWVRSFPDEVGAREELAAVLETLREIASTRDEDRSALLTVQHARRLARDAETATRLAVIEARLHLKLEQFDDSRRIADSLLLANPNPSIATAGQLAGVAALTGRARLAATLLRHTAPIDSLLAAGEVIVLPPAVEEAYLGLVAYGAMGAPSDTILAQASRLNRLISVLVPPDRQALIRAAVAPPALLAFPIVGAGPAHTSPIQAGYLFRMQRAFAQHDFAKVRSEFRRIGRLRKGMPPEEVAIEGTYLEAWLLAGIGDTVAAVARLDSSLTQLVGLRMDLKLPLMPEGAALVRAMALRADLAAARGDSVASRYWGNSIVRLWSGADRELQPLVNRMRQLAAGP